MSRRFHIITILCLFFVWFFFANVGHRVEKKKRKNHLFHLKSRFKRKVLHVHALTRVSPEKQTTDDNDVYFFFFTCELLFFFLLLILNCNLKLKGFQYLLVSLDSIES